MSLALGVKRDQDSGKASRIKAVYNQHESGRREKEIMERQKKITLDEKIAWEKMTAQEKMKEREEWIAQEKMEAREIMKAQEEMNPQDALKAQEEMMALEEMMANLEFFKKDQKSTEEAKVHTAGKNKQTIEVIETKLN